MYALNKSSNTINSISKVAYAELIGKDKKSVFKQKIRLQYNEYSYGDFTIPSNLVTGHYKLIVYTQWMRNAGSANFSQNDIYIVNPFLDYTNPKNGTQHKDENINAQITSPLLKMELNKLRFSKREKVVLQVKKSIDGVLSGNYSISVRKKSELFSPKRNSITAFVSPTQSENNVIKFVEAQNSYSVYAPEHKGELITGMVLDKNKTPAADVKVALSVPGESFIFSTTKTNKLGVFYFDIESSYTSNNAIIQVTNEKKEDFSIVVYEPAMFNYEQLKFNDLFVSVAQLESIKQRIVASQIENAFSSVKQDEITLTKPTARFYKADYVYKLDDFKRFSTISETMVEVVEHSWITKRRGKHTFHIRDYKSNKSELLPLILIDGLLVQNHEELYNYPSAQVKIINIITDRFLYRNETYGGVINVETVDKNYQLTSRGDYIKYLPLVQPLEKKEYHQPNYNRDVDKLKRIPDYRLQLYWNPSINFTNKEEQIEFYTSDITGDFEIYIEGFTNQGKPVSIKEIIQVR